MWNAGVDYTQENGWYRPKPSGGGGGGALAFDAISTQQSGSSWTHVAGAPVNKIIVWAFALDNVSSGNATASATLDSVSMPESVIARDTNLVGAYLYLWGMAGSFASGNHSIALTLGGSPSNIVAGSMSFTGGDAATCFDQTKSTGVNGTNGTTSTITTTSAVASGDILVDLACFEFPGASTSNLGPQATKFTNWTNGFPNLNGGLTTGAGSTITPSWQNDGGGSGGAWIALAASLKK